MKKLRIGIMAIILLFCFSAGAFAYNATAYTYTISEDGQWMRVQDAYLPVAVLYKDAGLSKPEDIFIKNDLIYISDTGNGRIVITNFDGEIVKTVGDDILSMPTGVFVDDEGQMLVADYWLSKVAFFSQTG